MKRLLCTVLLMALGVPLLASWDFVPFSEEWFDTFYCHEMIPIGNTDDYVAMAIDASGNIIVARRIRDLVGTSKNDVLTIKYNTDGDTLWTRTWKYIEPSYPDTLGEHANDVVVDDDGNIYVLVASNVHPEVSPYLETMDMVILKYDPSGTLIDSVRWDGTGDSDELVKKMYIDHSKSDIYVYGARKDYTIHFMPRWFVIKFDKNLNECWYHDMSDPEQRGTQPADLTMDSNGYIFATGHNCYAATDYDYFTIKYNPATGTIIDSVSWNYPSPGGQLDQATCLTIDASNNVIVSGHGNNKWSSPMLFQNYYTIKYDNDLNEIWAREYDHITKLADGVNDVVCDATGNVYITGTIQLNGEDGDIFTMKYSPTGDLLWTHRYNGPGYLVDAPAKCLLNSNETELYIAGKSAEIRFNMSLNDYQDDYILIILDAATGDSLQMLKYDGNCHYQDQPKDMELDADGNIFLTGHTLERADTSCFHITTIKYSRQSDNIPPESPYITRVEKVSNDAKLTWLKVINDTLGNTENTDRYVVYRNTAPDFIPGQPDSIGLTSHPDTTYTDVGVLSDGNNYYYLIKAVDISENRSRKSNMGFKFNKPFNQNHGATSDKNWVSIPWHNNYPNASDISDDLSPSGDPLTAITNLRNDQQYESWVYNFGWFGTNFSTIQGKAYEMSDTLHDTTLVIVGANNPDGGVPLNENVGDMGDKNWVSIPYNANYANASDITAEYAPIGDPLIVLTNMLNNQFYESWVYDTLFDEWSGMDFALERGRGYEFVTIIDTTWNPTEYTNRAKTFLAQKTHGPRSRCLAGDRTEPERAPFWKKTKTGYAELVRTHEHRKNHIAGISHIVRAHLAAEGLEDICFTAYRPALPCDVLTEHTVGSARVFKKARAALWFNTGNFAQPWQDEEELILIVEATIAGKPYYQAVLFNLDRAVDIQELGVLDLEPVPQPITHHTTVSWKYADNAHVIGYSLYDEGQRVNEELITETNLLCSVSDPLLRLVFRGGYESMLGSHAVLSEETPYQFSLTSYPNPCTGRTTILFALNVQQNITLTVFDVSGKQVRTLLAQKLTPGFHQVDWNGKDNRGKQVSNGIYFIKLQTPTHTAEKKVILLR